MNNINEKLLFDQLENYQIQRHDFLNYFQVIKGYLQLNMPEKALKYMDEVLEELTPQQEIYKVGQKTLMGILLGWFFKLRMKGIKMVITFPPEIKKEEFWVDHWQEEYGSRFYGYTKECSNIIQLDDLEEWLAKIEIGPASEGFSCDFKLLKKGNLNQHQVFSTDS